MNANISPDARAVAKLAAFCRFAADLAGLSTCKRASVGCLLVPDDMSEVLSIGYNGPPAGRDNDSCRNTAGSCGCVHAEANALVKLRRKEAAATLITTTCPCEHCAGLVVNSRSVDLVLFQVDYRDGAGRRVLEDAGIKCTSWMDMGVRGMTPDTTTVLRARTIVEAYEGDHGIQPGLHRDCYDVAQEVLKRQYPGVSGVLRGE